LWLLVSLLLLLEWMGLLEMLLLLQLVALLLKVLLLLLQIVLLGDGLSSLRPLLLLLLWLLILGHGRILEILFVEHNIYVSISVFRAHAERTGKHVRTVSSDVHHAICTCGCPMLGGWYATVVEPDRLPIPRACRWRPLCRISTCRPKKKQVYLAFPAARIVAKTH
jgi:hypothetical protein